MKGWLAEFHRARDKSWGTTRAIRRRVKLGGKEHLYTGLDTLVMELWSPGYLRAALLAAAGDTAALSVKIKFDLSRSGSAELINDIRTRFLEECESRPAICDISLPPEESAIVISLYTSQELALMKVDDATEA